MTFNYTIYYQIEHKGSQQGTELTIDIKFISSSHNIPTTAQANTDTKSQNDAVESVIVVTTSCKFTKKYHLTYHSTDDSHIYS